MPAKQRIVKKVNEFNVVEKSWMCLGCENMQCRTYHHVIKDMIEKHIFKVPVCDCSGLAMPTTCFRTQTCIRQTAQLQPPQRCHHCSDSGRQLRERTSN